MGAIKQAKQKLRSNTGSCLYCQGETPHDTVRVGLARFRWFGPPTRRARTVEVCRECGNYTFLPRLRVVSADSRTAVSAGR
jgi:hypothetical protein